ncbi:RNA dependent RNA polymerase-domain-containing protein [Xylaria palmicola]|nr:RNA dependent RNA polymerase-domain-containing protein [Xylaria palmicola]
MAQRQPTGYAVFMKNVPPQLTDQSLRAELLPFLTSLNIQDWICDKPRGKPFAILTFLHRKDGQTFLSRYGLQPLPRSNLFGEQKSRARLVILNKQIYCSESDRGVDSTLLRVLELDAEKRLRPPEPAEHSRRHNPVVFGAWALSCGHYEYPKGKLAYTADIQWPTTNGIAKFAKEALIVSFLQGRGQIRVEIPYRIIHEVVISDRPTTLFLTLWEPPRFFLQQTSEVLLMNQFRGLGIHDAPGLSRPGDRERLSKIPHDNADHGEILGQSLIYSITLSPEEFTSKVARLMENDTSINCSYMAEGFASFKSVIADCARIIPFDTLYQFQALVQNGYLLPLTAESLVCRLHANRLYSISKGAGNPEKTEAGAIATLLPFSAQAVKKLFSQIPFPGPGTEAKLLSADEIWSLLESNEHEIQLGLTRKLISERARQNLTMVYKVQVTPTRIIFNGPEPEAKNRILRKFSRHISYFARVQFCDEDGQDIYFNPKVSLDNIYARFVKILSVGFPIAGRLYKFLGFSHSSLRSRAVWFMAAFVDDDGRLRSYDRVISELGDFKGIRSPARCFVGAARIGQAFSETPIAINLEALQTTIELFPDVKSKDGSRVFSDGVGTISRDLLEAIRSRMPQKSGTATCLQIRWAGAKGMLSLDDTLSGTVMRVRDSMIKFNSNDTQNLEICDVANKPIPLVLNRQMIKILEDMRVPESWFFKAQNRELDRLRNITASTYNTVTFLKRQKIAEQLGFYRFIRSLQKLGLDYKKDPFLCAVVETVVMREVRLLKHKSRIPIEQGVTLFGVMDEFGFLSDDEVFITFDNQQGKTCPQLHNRFVIITRSPALHPGDIQIRRAVVPPRDHPLSSLSNCIVFSQKGSRDLPSQLSGGDLDGDIYNIIWDDCAVDECQLEFEPADYPRVPPLDIGRDVQVSDMTQFFVKFMATDQLGLIANRHIILADMHDAGTVHDDCKLLAEMHSTAVDYSKTGIAVDMKRMASLKRTNYRPDFIAPAPPANIVDKTEIRFEPLPVEEDGIDEDDESGPRHKFYKSDKILGKLYRAIDEKKIWKDDIHLVVNSSGPSLWGELFVHIVRQCESLAKVDWRRAITQADSIRRAYEDTIWTTSVDYSEHSSKAINEVEVFTGTIFNKSGIQTRRQRDTSIRLKDEFDRVIKWVESLIRKHDVQSSENPPDGNEDDLSEDYVDDGDEPGTESTALELSIACLHVGMTRVSRDRSDKRNTGDFDSFKVIAAQCALRELDLAVKQKDMADGAAFVSGGFVGVRSGRA